MHMTKQKVEDEVVECVRSYVTPNPTIIGRDTKFEDLDMDSLDRVELLFDVEDALDQELPDFDVVNIKTVGQMIDTVLTHVDFN